MPRQYAFCFSRGQRRRNRLFVNGKSMNATTTETRHGGHGGSWELGILDGLMSVALVDAQMLCISDVDRSWCSGSQKKPNEPSARKKKNTLTKKHVVNHRPCVGHLPQILQSLELKTPLFESETRLLGDADVALVDAGMRLTARMKKVLASFSKSLPACISQCSLKCFFFNFNNFNNYSFDPSPPTQ